MSAVSRRAWLLFLALGVLWGVPYLFIKIAVQEVHPVAVVFLRLVIALGVLLPVALRARVLGRLRGRWRGVLAVAAVEVVAPFLLITYGELRISSSLTGLLLAAVPLFVAVLALRVDARQRASTGRLVGLTVGIVGVALLLGVDVGSDGAAMLGSLFVLLAAACYALGALLIGKLFADVPGLAVMTAVVAVSALALTPPALVTMPPLWPPSAWPSPAVVSSIVLLGLASTAAAFLVMFALVAEAGAGRATVVTYVNPLVAVLLGVILLDERVSAATVAGFALVLVGSWLSTRQRPRPSTPAAPSSTPASVGRGGRGGVSTSSGEGRRPARRRRASGGGTTPGTRLRQN